MPITIKSCLENEVFHGHLSRKKNPKMKEYIFCKKNEVDIIDVRKTIKAIYRAKTFLNNVISNGETILFVSTQKIFSKYIEEKAKSLSMPYVSTKWSGGILTNFVTIRETIVGIETTKKMIENGEFKALVKKERKKKENDCKEKEELFKGIFNMNKIPNVLVIVGVKANFTAVKEAISRGITIVGIVDTDSDPENIDYVIPANDDSLKSVKLILDEIFEEKKNKEINVEIEKSKKATDEKPENIIEKNNVIFVNDETKIPEDMNIKGEDVNIKAKNMKIKENRVKEREKKEKNNKIKEKIKNKKFKEEIMKKNEEKIKEEIKQESEKEGKKKSKKKIIKENKNEVKKIIKKNEDENKKKIIKKVVKKILDKNKEKKRKEKNNKKK